MHTTRSTFSRAAAEVMTRFMGSALFPGGLGEFHAGAHQYLAPRGLSERRHAPQWATFYGWSLQLAGGAVRRAIIQCLRTLYEEGRAAATARTC